MYDDKEPPPVDFFTATEAAAACGVTRGNFNQARRCGEIAPDVQTGGGTLHLYSRSVIETYRESRRNRGLEAGPGLPARGQLPKKTAPSRIRRRATVEK